jgi:DNA-binding NarL/FixJ family response regulator
LLAAKGADAPRIAVKKGDGNAMSAYQVVLADDHVLLRQGLRRIIEEAPDLKVVGEVSDGVDLLQLLNSIIPDMVILDISMPNLRGIEAVREIKTRRPHIKILLLTMHREIEYLHQALTWGADGYILKDDADTELFAAIDRIRKGSRYVSPSLSTDLAEFLMRMRHEEGRLYSTSEILTNREREIIKLIAEGKTSKECAGILCISSRTVEHHRANIMDKLNIKKTADLVKYAVTKGYIEVNPHT